MECSELIVEVGERKFFVFEIKQFHIDRSISYCSENCQVQEHPFENGNRLNERITAVTKKKKILFLVCGKMKINLGLHTAG
jgi:hypothetical protein